MMPCEALLSRCRLQGLPSFYNILFRVWCTLVGGLANDGVLSVLASTDAPFPVDLIFLWISSLPTIYMLFHDLELLHRHTVCKNSCLLTVPCTGPRPGVSCTFATSTGQLLISTGWLRMGFSTRVPGWHTVST